MWPFASTIRRSLCRKHPRAQRARERLHRRKRLAIARVNQPPRAHEARLRYPSCDERSILDVPGRAPTREYGDTQVGCDHFENGFGQRHARRPLRLDPRATENIVQKMASLRRHVVREERLVGKVTRGEVCPRRQRMIRMEYCNEFVLEERDRRKPPIATRQGDECRVDLPAYQRVNRALRRFENDADVEIRVDAAQIGQRRREPAITRVALGRDP